MARVGRPKELYQLCRDDVRVLPLGRSPQQVQRWEAGTYRRATFATICKVAAALKVDIKGRAAK
jgi:transcriptional regulator with XRE-family HTH domain